MVALVERVLVYVWLQVTMAGFFILVCGII